MEKTTLQETVNSYNAAVDAGDYAEIMALDAQIKEGVKNLNAVERKTQLAFWAGQENPTMSCLKDSSGFYTLTATKRENETNYLTLEAKTSVVDLYDLYLVKPAVFGKQWQVQVEALNFAVKDLIMEDLGITKVSERLAGYQKSAVVAQLGITAADLRNSETMTAGLNNVVQSIVGESYNCRATDINAVKALYARQGKKTNAVVLAVSARFRKQLTPILVNIVQELEYEGE